MVMTMLVRYAKRREGVSALAQKSERKKGGNRKTQLAIEIRIRCEIKAISDNHLQWRIISHESFHLAFPFVPFTLLITIKVDDIPWFGVGSRQDDTLSGNICDDGAIGNNDGNWFLSFVEIRRSSANTFFLFFGKTHLEEGSDWGDHYRLSFSCKWCLLDSRGESLCEVIMFRGTFAGCGLR